MLPFDSAESGFTRTAGTLTNDNDQQGLSFPTWGNPERAAINDMARFTNTYMGGLA